MAPSLLLSISALVLAITLVANPAADAGRNSTAAHAPFGTITSKPGECVVGNPNSYINAKDLQWIWNNRMKSDVEPYDNWIIDHIVKNKGSLNYCVRWDSQTMTLTKAMLARQYAAWNHLLIGYNCWPYDDIKINIVGSARLLERTGAPQCPENCYRSPDGFGGLPEPNGCDSKPFDVSLWPTEGMTGGLGKYNFQQFGIDMLLDGIDNEQLTVAAHEIGHSFGLPNFYEMPQPPKT